MTWPQLYELIKQRTEGKEVKYNTYEIARERGHTILKTPPYHCELQPIEKIWGVAKQQMAALNTGNETVFTVHQKLNKVFSEIPSSTFVAQWQGTVKKCREYHMQQ